jgi:hypothetical protein
LYSKNHADPTRKGQLRFISHGSTGDGIGFYNYDPAVPTWRATMIVTNDNKVYIGDVKPTGAYANYKLGVDGTIVAKRVVVQTGSWADFVFDDAYSLLPLSELGAYINTHRHLPDVPTAADVETHGADVGEMNQILLQKVEELTLYIIDLQKQIDNLKK